MIKKLLALALCLTFTFSCFTACDGGSQSDTGSNDSENSGGITVPDDYGNPEEWGGDKVSTVDLGDCIIDSYPYDDRYDWGQSIIYDEDDEVYKMWWCRQSGYDSIWYAESKDLKHWYSAQKLLAVEQDTTWIKMHVGKPSVIKVDDEYKMYFEAPATLNGFKEFDNNVFLATSTDGKKWNIKGKNGEPYPIIRMTDEQMADSWNISQLAGGSGYGFYGFGQPSVTYKDGVYYLYYTHTLIEGDRMYVATSTDGENFTEGQQVFLRAGSGVKYNVKTGKFMYAYEYTSGSVSKIYYMESTDGVHFTYSDYAGAAANENVLSKGAGFVRGYPDFVSNGLGQVTGYTCYVAYMEGKMADAGKDWRQYSSTWDIHIAMFNPAEFENRPMQLPNGKINSKENLTSYRDKHLSAYESKREALIKGEDGDVTAVDKSLYANKTTLYADRVSCVENAVPGKISATLYLRYTELYLYVFVEVKDASADESDYVYIGVDEKHVAKNAIEISNVEISRKGITVTDGESNNITNVKTSLKLVEGGYNAEIKLAWRYISGNDIDANIGFDCFVYNNRNSSEYKSVIAWNDYKLRYSSKHFGEMYLKG